MEQNGRDVVAQRLRRERVKGRAAVYTVREVKPHVGMFGTVGTRDVETAFSSIVLLPDPLAAELVMMNAKWAHAVGSRAHAEVAEKLLYVPTLRSAHRRVGGGIRRSRATPSTHW